MTSSAGPVRYAPSERGYVAFQTAGEGGSGRPDLVLIYTLTADFESLWELPAAVHVLGQLAVHCRVVLVNPRGTGSSDPLQPGEVPDAAAHALDVAAVLDDLGGQPAVVVGESYSGGPTALRLAADRPDLVARVVTINLPLAPATGDIDTAAAVEAVLWGGDLEISQELTPSVTGDEFYEAWAQRAGRATSPTVARGYWEEMLRYDISDVVGRVTAPVTVFVTGHWTAPTEGVVALAEALPDATIVDVPRVDSLLFLGDTRQLVEELLLAATGSRHASPPRRRLLAILFTDLEASTARAAEVGDAGWRELLDRHDRLSHRAVANHDGEVVKATGDGLLATFQLTSAAVSCALDLIDSLRAAGLPARAGVHVGEVEVRDDDIGGLAVHVAARIAAEADADEVLVSEAVRLTTVGGGQAYGPPTLHELRGVPGRWPLARALR